MEANRDGTHYQAVPPTPTPGTKVTHAPPCTTFRDGQVNPLNSASLFSLLSIHWLQPLVTLGAQRTLNKDDVWRVCSQDSCEELYGRFSSKYRAAQWLQLWPVAMALARAFRRDLIVIFGCYFVYVAAMAIQPLVSNALLDFLNDRENVFRIGSGYVLVTLMAVASLVGVSCLNYAFFLSSRVGANMRSVIMDTVYRKSLALSCVARQTYSTGEIVTLMSVDSERVFYGTMNGPWIIVAPFAFVVTILLAALMFDPISALCGDVLLAFILFASTRIADRIGALQEEILMHAEERVKVTSEALQGIRVMKLYAWEESLARRVEKIREVEVRLYRQFHFLQIVNATLLFLTPVFLGAVIFVVYLLYHDNLTVTEVYTLLAIVNISRMAVNMFPQAMAAVAKAKIAYARIDKYLASDELGPALLESDTTDQQAMPPGSILAVSANFHWSAPEFSASSECLERSSAPGSSGFSLADVNVEIDAGSLVMIVGKVGAGKSSLMEALLGEMIQSTGLLHVHGEIAYVSQEAWIRNLSVKDNILFEAPFDHSRYSQVLEATQLAMDLLALPDGDQTEIGERGINLSGGQKARVSIARAMYRSEYDILMLDDPLSAVDPHVAHAIFNECVMGLAKKKTRLLALNSHYDLLIHADRILVLEDGRITGNGTYAEVLRQFPDLDTKSAKPQQEKRDLGNELQVAEDESVAVQTTVTRTRSLQASGEDASHLIQEEDRIKGRVSGKIYMAYFNETGYNGIVVVLVLVAGYFSSQGLRVLVDWWQGHWAANMGRDGVDPTYSGTWFGMWYLAFILSCSVVTVGRGLLMMESCMRSSKNLHDELFRRVLSAPINRYFDVTPVGRILNRFSNDLDQVDSNLPQQYQDLFQSTAIFLVCLGVCASASVWVGVSYLPMMGVFVVTGLYFKKTSREVKRLEGITRSPVFTLFSETLNGLHTIRAFKMQSRFVEINKAAVDDNTAFYFTYWAAGRWLAVRLDYLSVVVIVVVTLYLVVSKGQIDSVVAGISLTYSLMLTSMVQWVVRAADMTDNAMTSVERLLHFRGIPIEEDSQSLEPVSFASWPSQGAIQFDNLHLKYRPELPLVLRGVTMDICAGEKVGICGRTGAGKSSLMVALFRICEFERGTILIDGTDIQRIRLRDLRRSLAIIPQDPVLFSGTLRENLDPCAESSDSAIWAVLKQVHLAASVAKWGAGLEFIVAEQGENMSVGQRQLLCIGRALLKDSKIAVLDEATANVDAATDNLIQSTIRDTLQSKTVLIIAHRIDTIMHCDKIAVMDAGTVVEFDAPSDLVSRPESIFASLVTTSVIKY